MVDQGSKEGVKEAMNMDRLLGNLIGQIKEAQIKLGYTKETIRLYFPADSICRLLDCNCGSPKELLVMLQQEEGFCHTVLGKLTFSLCKGERIEVRISADGAAYVKEQVPDPPFLSGIIELFRENQHLTMEELCTFFGKFNDHYICEKMKPDADFDYVLYFPDGKPDSWYYCVRLEMDHTIYHRFTKADYRMITA
ncbi:MAG: DUF3877 family protein [Fusicatenibacter sp.]|nr:DUF3877 family protein [Fusicatenibacter sp.]